ncbi:protein tyrosine phosphatase 1 [Anticarsia gemmatalis multiple nucleopolyhedrovirus]|uniref:Protein tyrosine phosphatase 1 n=1 Tax=Anticarsia gemmatalis multiple nucleopolyhedrovirus TaxID=268591 RepID=A0A0S3IXJ9_9ABAC|nr:protein tyrosine phosphatase 1 [Anticarsia gemmatalis multiple nucleopolyhedrovirus]ALR70276.1 protein tyrosine phosphatase 1 [Anticarsia gemmatalis multiple nucleopolyhedrovirus]ALR70589.1 protein tyrosine phosphatase 1 [Anticarsia gemmatalis multiple nucleopolyhedrovirus]ALR70746.1 protein tyrosine phosphatase 1 [Anticarsia gemmatalis multiple nucleopolyhedrovirus]ALR71219.1 protein tyrosine phosphatase 1 [Anticarsia gemmatalis multiple nucleopolyhedrovirus]ALR71690.1 protein tyrosine pho
MFPRRWHNYTTCGKVIEGTNLICFKVPLEQEVFEYVTNDEDRWTVYNLVNSHRTLGAVIDLTNTLRYYDGAEVRDAGVLYKKIRVPGQEVPNEDIVQEFFDTVQEFSAQCPGMLIGVHCTHGLNRTGYLVCRYIIDKLHVSPADAIARFEAARGHKIERRNYLEDLLKRHHVRR